MTDTDSAPEATAPAPASDSEVVDDLGRGGPGTLAQRMGIELKTVSAAKVVGTMPVAGNTQPYGLLHGGASVVLAETLGSYAAALHAGPGRRAVGIEVNATHHRAAREGRVTGTAVAVHLGTTTATYEIVIEQASHRICTARLTCLLMDDRP